MLELVAAMADWKGPDHAGCARGVAMREAFGTIVAQVAEVTLGDDGRVRVTRVWSAVDPGEVINPKTFTAQIQGGAIYGLTAALYGQISIDKGRVVEKNFPDYEMVRMADAPVHEVRFIESGAHGRRRRAGHRAHRRSGGQRDLQAHGRADSRTAVQEFRPDDRQQDRVALVEL